MTAAANPDVYAFLKSKRSDFITLWEKVTNDAFAAHLHSSGEECLQISIEEIAPIFDADGLRLRG